MWGGGIREKRAFWEQCDRLGIMAMQEFPLACAFLDHYPRDPGYLSVLESEAEGIVRGLRNHPSLIAWCGGNEISPRRERLPSAYYRSACCKREDPARPWIPASPSQGDIHNWDVWHGVCALADRFAQVTAPFMSEFGCRRCHRSRRFARCSRPACPPSLDDATVGRAQAAGEQACGTTPGPVHRGGPGSHVGATQRTQAAGLQAGIEACRLRRGGLGQSRHRVAAWPSGSSTSRGRSFPGR